jgi:hypothetical protein
MALSEHGRRKVQREADQLIGQTLPEMSALRRRVLSALLVRTAEGWHLFVRDDGARQADAFLIGPSGLFAAMIGEEPPDAVIAHEVMRHAEERCADIRGSRGQVLAAGVRHVVIVPGGSPRDGAHSRRYWLLSELELPRLFDRDAVHLDRRQVGAIADQVSARLPGFRYLRVSPPEREQDQSKLIEEKDVTDQNLEKAQQRPFDTWMSFLHPQQNAVVKRDYMGPARISGPAGTGKTVVALHRLRYLAMQSTGPLLFTAFVRTLPLVHQKSFRRLAPEVADRVEFTNLHAWIREFLTARGREITVVPSQVDTAFGRAWMAHRGPLELLEKSPPYWQAEIDRVIKGRGIQTLEEYVRVPRRGRTLRLDAAQRALVWRLFEGYQENLAAKGLHDHHDMISIALAELTARPVERPYAAVVVDEVQDITLNGLRLLRQLAGDGQNRLLLVGDGQQQVYPGGWRLSDAGIPIQGRGEVLRVNYRNRAEVLGFAQRFDAVNEVDDLDGAAGGALRDAEVANSGGEARSWRGPERDLPGALVETISALPAPLLGHTALIAFQRRDLDQCTAVLRKAGIAFLPLEQYEGEPDDRLKVGTVHRAKGLDFQAVLAVHFTRNAATGTAIEEETRMRQERQHLVAATRARDFLWWAVAEPNTDR